MHGEQNEMSRLKAALQREYEDDPNTSIQLHNPRNTVSVELYFRGEKTAKVMGSLAVDRPKPGNSLSGILVKRNFNYHILSANDLNSKFLCNLIKPSINIFSFRIYRYEYDTSHTTAKHSLFRHPECFTPFYNSGSRSPGGHRRRQENESFQCN